MASIPSSWLPPVAVAVAAASRIPRLVHVHPLSQRGPSSAVQVKMQPPLRTRDVFRSNCDKHLREPAEPADNHDPNNAASSKNIHPLVQKMREYLAEMGVVRPDMFPEEKDRISNYIMELSSSANSLNVEDRVVAQIFCTRAQNALDLASKVMEIASLGCGMIEICQHTVDQMVRTYASIFCKFAEDAYHHDEKKMEMETILSFVAALRCLGSIFHIMVEDTVAKLKDGPLKSIIICRVDVCSQRFVKTVKHLEDMIAETKSQLEATDLLYYVVGSARSYIHQLNECLEVAVAKL